MTPAAREVAPKRRIVDCENEYMVVRVDEGVRRLLDQDEYWC